MPTTAGEFCIFNITRQPTGFWITQQLREAFPFDQGQRFLIHDRDSKFGETVGTAIAEIGMEPIRTSLRRPWQNGVAERWVGVAGEICSTT